MYGIRSFYTGKKKSSFAVIAADIGKDDGVAGHKIGAPPFLVGLAIICIITAAALNETVTVIIAGAYGDLLFLVVDNICKRTYQKTYAKHYVLSHLVDRYDITVRKVNGCRHPVVLAFDIGIFFAGKGNEKQGDEKEFFHGDEFCDGGTDLKLGFFNHRVYGVKMEFHRVCFILPLRHKDTKLHKECIIFSSFVILSGLVSLWPLSLPLRHKDRKMHKGKQVLY